MALRTKFQTYSVTIIWSLILLLLLYTLFSSNNIEHLLLVVATFMIVLHTWWGAIFYIKNVGPSQGTIETLIDLVCIGLLVFSIFSINNIVAWFFVFTIFFVATVLKYGIGLARTTRHPIRKYIRIKIKYESAAILLFFVGGFIGAIFNNSQIYLFLATNAFLLQIPFIYFLSFRSKVYRIPFED
jgi:hypothetical protein